MTCIKNRFQFLLNSLVFRLKHLHEISFLHLHSLHKVLHCRVSYHLHFPLFLFNYHHLRQEIHYFKSSLLHVIQISLLPLPFHIFTIHSPPLLNKTIQLMSFKYQNSVKMRFLLFQFFQLFQLFQRFQLFIQLRIQI